MPQFSPNTKVVVLGAGATRGASFVGNHATGCVPPLNTDFFTQLQRMNEEKHHDLVNGVIQDVVDLFGSNFNLTLEGYFTYLEAMKAVAERSGREQRSDLIEKRGRLLDSLAAVMEESAEVTKRDATGNLPRACGYHSRLVRSLRKRDTIVSFNYDCTVDHALRTAAARKWSARYGYGFRRPVRVQGYERWEGEGAPTKQNDSINLLKMHGSLNWFPLPKADDDDIKLRQRTYRQHGSNRYEIVPPEFVKQIDSQPVLRQIWQYAELAIRRARVLAFVGFSFAPTDLLVESTFRLSIAKNKKLEKVVIVNPDGAARRRIRDVLSKALSSGSVRVVQYETFKEFAGALPTALR